MRIRIITEWCVRALLTVTYAFVIYGCGTYEGGWGAPSTPPSSGNGFSSLEIHNCSAYNASVYRDLGNNTSYEKVGSLPPFQGAGACNAATAPTSVIVGLADGASEHVRVLFKNGNCTDDPELVVHCPAVDIYAEGSATGQISTRFVNKP